MAFFPSSKDLEGFVGQGQILEVLWTTTNLKKTVTNCDRRDKDQGFLYE